MGTSNSERGLGKGPTSVPATRTVRHRDQSKKSAGFSAPSESPFQHNLLNLQRSAGNSAVALFVQRHQIPESRSGEGDEDDEVEVSRSPSDTLVDRHVHPRRSSHRSRHHVARRVPGFGSALRTRPLTSPRPYEPRIDRKEATPSVAAVAIAKEEFKKFVTGGPYQRSNFVPDFTEGFGKFDTAYRPAAKRLDINMRIKFTFPDLPFPKVNSVKTLGQAAQVAAIQAAYITKFLNQVHTQWSGRHEFRNKREPQAVWGKLNPISVRLKVVPVQKNQHYVMAAFLKKSGTAKVSPNPVGGKAGTVTLFKGDLDPSTQGLTAAGVTGPGEIVRLQRNLPKIRFASGSAKIRTRYLRDLQYIADYLKRMNRPKFHINVTGFSNKGGASATNMAISITRARAVHDKMKALGVTNHGLKFTGVGDTGSTAHGRFRKVDFGISVDKSFSNIQDTTAHEFGHMLGLDDEYVTPRKKQLQHQRKFTRKMLGNSAYGPKQRNKYANEVTKRGPNASGSVMESGNEVRVYHYVTMWQALYDAASTAKNQPSPPFTWRDWKVIG